MKNINFKQFVVLIFIFFFLFGDFNSLKKKLKVFSKYVNNFVLKKNRKKGT